MKAILCHRLSFKAVGLFLVLIAGYSVVAHGDPGEDDARNQPKPAPISVQLDKLCYNDSLSNTTNSRDCNDALTNLNKMANEKIVFSGSCTHVSHCFRDVDGWWHDGYLLDVTVIVLQP